MMIKRLTPLFLIFTFLFLLLAIVLAWLPVLAQGPDTPKGPEPLPTPATPVPSLDPTLLPKIEPQLLKKLLTGAEPIPFIVYLNTAADLSAVSAPTEAGGQPDRLAQRAAVVNALQQTAQNSQSGVLQQLSAGQLSAQAADIRPLWIVNAIAAKGTLPTVLALAARPDVSVIRMDKTVSIINNQLPIANSQFTIQSQRPPVGNSQFLSPLSSPTWGINKIRADLVHNALGFNGAGVVVANIDTGVDWLHPALQTKYRGYTGPGKLPLHAGNWFDVTGGGAVYPVDGNGHGTHTMGTMVGDNGVGVAPGATWIAVKAFSSAGQAQNSWLHAAFQWILAPNNNPALAPDIVNNSWGSNDGYSTEFQPDVQALLNAGIYPVFSAGNNGPGSQTIGSPGSLTMTLAVGATTSDDEIANFSSRGPSAWGQIKPDVSAPGKDVLSTLPGGAYGEYNGTSMAAPHVSGLAVLLLQASPTLSTNLSHISTIITTTAVRLGSPIPNNNYGWGRIDAYNAVMSVAAVGVMQGNVTGVGVPLNNAVVQITAHSGGPAINATTTISGDYRQGLAANTYDATASAFGYAPMAAYGITITNQTAVTQNFNLTPLPTGVLTGVIREKGTDAPLAAAINIDQTPVSAATNPTNGRYSLTLPAGVYSATVIAAAHRITQAVNITINDGATVTQDFWLDPAPAILLVDSGRWYQESQIGYYQQALTDLLYPYDTWSITRPFDIPTDVPTITTLTKYQIVIWSSPLDSPGYVQADTALESYLDTGGKLLISGQDVAYFDGGGGLSGIAPYFQNYLKARYIEENTTVFTTTGAGPLAGLSLTLTGGDGANNQVTPDVLANAGPDFAGELFAYGDGRLAGLHVGLCVPYKAMLLPFGFEAINSRANRQTVMQGAINWLMQAPAANGVELTPADETKIGNFGTVVTHAIRLRNTGVTADTYTLSLSPGVPYNWPVNLLSPTSIILPTCQSQTITLTMQVSPTHTWHISDTRTLTAQSTHNPTLTDVATRTGQTPAPVLLVDDDRWYSFAPQFKAALEANAVPYDYWYVPKSWSGPAPSSPPLSTLQMYPLTVWYTGYDWYQPLTTAEEDRLAAYLDGGGRLFFSGQDYIYNLPHHVVSPFAITYLGVLSHTEDYSSTVVSGERYNPVGNHLGTYPLTFPPGYTNWTDGLTTTTSAQAATVGQAGQVNSVTNAGLGPAGRRWRTNFLAFGPELLADADRARLMQRSLGWLSWLGGSTVTTSVSAVLDGATVVYTATVTNDGWDRLPAAAFTATFPSQLTVLTYSPELAATGGSLVWHGPLDINQSRVFTYAAAIAGGLPPGTLVSQTSWLAYPDHNILFDRIVDIYVNFPILDTATMSVTPTQGVEPGSVLTYTITLANTGLIDDPLVTTTNTLPHMLDGLSVDPPERGVVVTAGKTLTWTTPLSKNETVTLTYRAVISYRTAGDIENKANVNDNLNEPLVLTARAQFKTLPIYLPVIFKH